MERVIGIGVVVEHPDPVLNGDVGIELDLSGVYVHESKGQHRRGAAEDRRPCRCLR